MTEMLNYNSNWRKVASTIYKKPTDSKIFGIVELDVTELEKYVAQKRKEGIKTTLTYLMTIIIGRAIRQEVPELNTFVKRGKIIQRKQVDATVSVLLPGGQMGSVKVENADQLTTAEISENIGNNIANSRKGKENDEMQSKSLLAKLPWPFRNWLFKIYQTITINWGISMPVFGLDSNSFGSYVISNIGTVGLDTGFGSLLPSSNISFVFVLGTINKKPIVVNDEVVVRRVMLLSSTLDHRVVDGSHGGRLFRYIKQVAKNPEILDTKPDASTSMF
ncbi:MAG TPA: 2-oxo acid dehydrogenase subunit E2 [Draconibacterium sp.]|nr:2-oxo acid dehydrogenase subunit E2 [Draconibacterium sp.]HRX10084.1 2-oxo acid dehydrogenase subunit E2 [Draconibacterium sp.]